MGVYFHRSVVMFINFLRLLCSSRCWFPRALLLSALAGITTTNLGFSQERPLIGGSDAPAILHAASFEPLQFPETRLPLGGIVTIFGTNLGPANGISASSLPLGTELGGTSIEITAGGKTVGAWMLFSSANQINAIIPSRVAEGLAHIRVVRGGIPSPDVGIRLGRSAFGMFTLNQQGSGPAVVQNINSATDQPVNDLFHPAAPGQVLTVWGSGLGPVAGDDSQPGPVENLDADVHVFVGDTESQVLYKGRSPQFPGLDQINLRLSENVPLGCRVPITVVVDGRTSNFGTLAIASRGERCNEPHGLDSNTYERISAGETLNIGWFQFTRLMVALPVAEIRAIIDFGFGDVFAAGQLTRISILTLVRRQYTPALPEYHVFPR